MFLSSRLFKYKMLSNIPSIVRNQSKVVACCSARAFSSNTDSSSGKTSSKEDRKDLKEFRKTPIGKLEEVEGKHPYAEKDPLPEWENGVNPETGEIGGPRGVEPTRYGDWERKGRVSDF